MPSFFETRSYWHGGFTKDQQEYYKEHRLSQKGIHLWKQLHQFYEYARNLCSIYNISICRDESCCFMRHKHLAFQCEYNDDETLASYAKRNYDFDDAEQIEEFVAYKLLNSIRYLRYFSRNSIIVTPPLLFKISPAI